MSKRRIGEVDIEVLDAPGALALVDRALGDTTPLMIAFCNAHTVNMARHDGAFASALTAATVLNDGIGVDLASRMLHGRGFADNLNGTDFTPAVLTTARRPLRLFLLGSAPDVIETARAAIERRFYQHQVVGHQHGFFKDAEEQRIFGDIAAARPDLILVGMGHPRQELWAARHLGRIPAVIMCIGAYLDFAAGQVPRAPSWIRGLRAEWLYRLAIEPRRLAHRYLIGNITFLAGVARQYVRERGRGRV